MHLRKHQSHHRRSAVALALEHRSPPKAGFYASIVISIPVVAACVRGCSARSWLTGYSDGTKIIGHEGAGVACMYNKQ